MIVWLLSSVCAAEAAIGSRFQRETDSKTGEGRERCRVAATAASQEVGSIRSRYSL